MTIFARKHVRIYEQENVLIYKTQKSFWDFYYALPKVIQDRADEKFKLLKDNPQHPSLRLKKVGEDWVVRINRDYRALAIEENDNIVWYWIGKHDEYMKLIREIEEVYIYK